MGFLESGCRCLSTPKSTVAQLKIRLKEPLRAALAEAAGRRGVTLNAEVVARLEQSFEEKQRLEDVFGGIDVYRLVRTIGSIMDAVGSTALRYKPTPAFVDAREARWPADPYAYDQALQAAQQALQALRPPGDPAAPRGVNNAVASTLGSRMALRMLQAMRGALDELPPHGDDQ